MLLSELRSSACRMRQTAMSARLNIPTARIMRLRCSATAKKAPPVGPVEVSIRPASPRTKDLASRIMMAPNLNASARAIVVGAGGLPVVETLKYLGVQDILVVDPTADFLSVVTTAFGSAGTLGNDPAVRTWRGDFCELPGYQGSADAVVFTEEAFGTLQSPRDALTKACLVLKPGGSIIINSDTDSRRWQPKFPPTREALAALVKGLPVSIHSEQEVDNGYCGILQIPPNYRLRAPFVLEGAVVKGYGRGSRQMGTPTANIDTSNLKRVLQVLAPGVYFGFAKVDAPKGWPEVDRQIHKAVLNIGVRPTVNKGGEAASVEVHLLHEFQGGQEFYGSHLKVVVLGFVRPEMKFNGVDALINRIKADTAIARVQLDTPAMASGALLLTE